MGVGIGGNIGFDEGGVLQAISRPFRSKTVKTYSYRTPRGHEKAVLVSETVLVKEYSMADVVVILVALGIMKWGPGAADASKDLPWHLGFGASGVMAKGMYDWLKPTWDNVVTDTPQIFDIVPDPRDVLPDPINIFGNNEYTGRALDVTVDMLKRVMDPFGFFD